MKAEVTVTKIGEKWFEIKEVEAPTQPETTEPTLPTLMEVFNKVKPEWILDVNNEPSHDEFVANSAYHHNQVSTETQCKRNQTLIALQNIADYYNGEVDYRGRGCHIFHHSDMTYVTTNHDNYHSVPKFKQKEHAQLAIEILRNENLLDNLK